jgi:hypothetical protein
MAIFNVPAPAGVYEQFVFNTITRAPCRFKGVPARCWGLLNDSAYFGSANAVFLFDTGTSDNGAEIVATAVQAFNKFGSAAQRKGFKQCQAILTAEAPPSVGLDMVMDYRLEVPAPVPADSQAALARWDEALWDQALWAGETVFDQWRGVRGIGRVAAVRLISVSQFSRPSWLATNVIYVPGGTL